MPPAYRKPTLLLLSAFWLFSAVFYASQPIGWKLLYGQPLQWREMLGAGLAWLFCIPLSLVCLALPRHLPLHGVDRRRQLWRLAAVGVAVALGLFALDVLSFRIALIGADRHPPILQYVTMLAVSRAHTYLLIYLLLAGLAYALDHFARTQALEAEAARHAVAAAELQRDLTNARLRTLRMQLQPHFVFNAHHAIVGLMLNGETDKAIRMLTQLSDLLRHTLDEGDGPEVTLRRELALLRQYLEIQQIRFGDRLRIEITAAETLLDASLPSLLLQPLVENAVRHGIDRHVAAGWIRVGAARDGARLVLTVENSGAGAPVPAGLTPRRGIGLATTRARLQQTYGAEHDLSMAPTESGGMKVTVSLPWRVCASSPAAAAAITS
jgi:hypothetical protein